MKTLLTAAALAFAIPAGAALADTHCDVPTANMQSWESLIQLTKDFGWSISKMELDDGCYEVRGTDADGHQIRVKIDPGNLDLVEMRIRYRDRDGRRTGSPEGEHV